MAWEFQEVDVSVLRIFYSKPGIPNNSAFSSRPRHLILAVFERLHPAYSLNFVDHLYVILYFYLVCLLYMLQLLVFSI